jgi:hypothetical protein
MFIFQSSRAAKYSETKTKPSLHRPQLSAGHLQKEEFAVINIFCSSEASLRDLSVILRNVTIKRIRPQFPRCHRRAES